MHGEPTAIDALARPRVYGLGVCDVLRVELDPVQLPWLIDEIEEMRGPLEEQLQRTRAEHERRDDDETARELAERSYHLRLLRLMRARLPCRDYEQPTTFLGPSAMVSDIVQATMRNVTATLSETAARSPGDRQQEEFLHRTAIAARAWVETFLACRAATSFNFDGEADPGRQW